MTAETDPKPDRRRVRLRMHDSTLCLIDLAARLSGRSRSAFMIEAARKAAEETLAEQTMFRVDAESFGRYLAVLDAPPSGEGFQRLMEARKLW